MNKQETINKIKNIDNILKYSIKGGTSMFNKEYPELLNNINEHTKEMQIYASNKKLIAKLIYLKKYKGDINNIMFDDKLMIYDNKLNDFKIANINATQKQWDTCKKELSNINELYTKKETIELLKNNYKNYFGKSGNRKLLRDNKKLYLSVLKHTSNLNTLNRNFNKFSMRLYILINDIDIYCHKHNNSIKFWKFDKGNFTISCSKCEPHYPSVEWFKKTYGTNWKFMCDKRKIELSNKMVSSLNWYEEKYGKVIGREKYDESVYNKMIAMSNLKANKCSKISQDLFWKIYNRLNNKTNVYFHDLNHEYVEKISKNYNYKNSIMLHDFKQNNKIIEYNGIYWHDNINDNIRYSVLKKMGYDILVVTSNEYSQHKKDEKIIDKCVNFLQ